MKNIYYAAILLFVASCAPAHQETTPTITSVAPTTFLQATPVTIKTTYPSPDRETVIREPYNPSEWEWIFHQDMVWEIGVSPIQGFWIRLMHAQVGYRDEANWFLFSEEDFGISGRISDMVIAHDGTVWISGTGKIARYKNGLWSTFTTPCYDDGGREVITVDSDGMLWFTYGLRLCNNNIMNFDGYRWGEITNPVEYGRAKQLLFTPDGSLWASFGWAQGIGRYNGETWRLYSGEELWLSGPWPNHNIVITSDRKGDVYAISGGSCSLVVIKNEKEKIIRIPIPCEELVLDDFRLRLFVDSNNAIWMNACLRDKNNYYEVDRTCITFYNGTQWTTMTDLPFKFVDAINGLPDGTMLFGTERGLFQYKKHN